VACWNWIKGSLLVIHQHTDVSLLNVVCEHGVDLDSRVLLVVSLRRSAKRFQFTLGNDRVPRSITLTDLQVKRSKKAIVSY
jgi:hypothetical protein